MSYRIVDIYTIRKRLEKLKEEHYQLGLKKTEPKHLLASACYQRAIDIIKEVMGCD